MARELKSEMVSYGGLRLMWSPGDGPGHYVTGITVRIDHPSNKSLHDRWVRLDMSPNVARMVARELTAYASKVEELQADLDDRYKSALEESHKDA